MTATVPQYGPRRQALGPAGPSEGITAAAGPNLAPGTSHPVDLSRAYDGESYYDLPPVTKSHYGWAIVAYFFIGGLASAAQFIATVADLVGGQRDREIVRAGRYLALFGSLISPVLLIADLHKPLRWYNMLRIYRGTSAMSIGAWALSLFGAFSGLAAVGQFADDAGVRIGGTLARVAGWPAALAGGIVALYTGTLMAATNLPLVASAFPYLSSLFASSAASTAAAALTLAVESGPAPAASRTRLNLIALIAGFVELVFALLVSRNWRRDAVTGTISGTLAAGYRAGVLGLGIGLPLIGHVALAVAPGKDGAGQRRAAVLAALAALAGGFILRAVFVFGGNRSAEKPQNYFRMTRQEAGHDRT